LLHRIFLEALRRDFQQKKPEDLEAETVILRYCEQGINLKNQKNEQVAQIPPQTMIAILNALPRFDPKIWPQPERFDPSRFENDEDKTREKTVLTIFSYGKRRCPANLITEFIFQTFIAELVMNYDLSLIHGDDLKQAEIELQPLVADLEQEYKHLTSSQI
jgi:cytochrome P450